MGSPRSATAQRRVFLLALPAALVTVGASAVLVDERFATSTRETAASVGLLVAGLAAMTSAAWRAAQTSGRRRRSWRLLTAAAGVAMAANVVGAVIGVDNVGAPTLVTDVILVLAMLLAIVGLATFPSVSRRGAEHVVMTLDGLVVGGAVLAMAAVMVYPELLASSTDGVAERFVMLLFPILDIVLVTVTVLLVLRAGGPDRPSLLLISGGFLAYALTDLQFAVQSAQDDYVFGSRLDLGWILGYVLVTLAACYPNHIEDEPEHRPAAGTSSARGAVLIFSVVLAAGVVQVSRGEQLAGPNAWLWLGIVVAAGVRQALLSADNASLRRGLERRVREQTADLRRLAREQETLLASVGDGIYGVDTRGRITFANPAAALSLGLADEELIGRDAHHLLHGHDEAERAERGVPEECYIRTAIDTGSVVSGIEDSYGRAAGGRLPVEITASPVLGADDGEPRGAVVVFRDVTQRHEVDRMKNEFLSVVSHELRTPLTSIRGALGLLAGGAVGTLGARASAMVSVAVESSERLTRLINDLLDIERLGSGSRPMRLADLDAEGLVTTAVHQIEGLAAPLGVRVETAPSSGRVLADEDQLMQTLTNLLGNAVKFSDPGGVVVAEAIRQDGHVEFRVRDQGRGIPDDKLELVFEPFAQVDSSDTRQKGGTGLGLAISRSIVERHGGRIWAESVYGEGTTVRFTLPVAP